MQKPALSGQYYNTPAFRSLPLESVLSLVESVACSVSRDPSPFGLALAERLRSGKRVPVAGRKAPSELRRAERIPLAIPVFVRGVDQRGNDFLEFTTALNVSNGGVLLATRQKLPRFTRVSLEVPSAPLPHLTSSPHFVRTREARLVRLAASNGCNLWGLKFTRPLK